MGMIDRFLGAGRAVADVAGAAGGVAGVFRENATRRMELAGNARLRALDELSSEFAHPPAGGFDRLVDGLNRLPRPLMTMGTLALFGYAMLEPQGFGLRMENLALVPEPMWWLLGAIISFYFGAREAHYHRTRPRQTSRPAPLPTPAAPAPATAGDDFADNAALAEWAASRHPATR